MRKVMCLALTGLLAAATSYAATNEVYSVNVVGFQKLNVRSNGLTMVNVPFDAASNTLDGIFGAQLSGGKSELSADGVQIWVNGAYKRYILKNTDMLWYDVDTGLRATGVYIYPEMGMWVRNRTTTTRVVTVVGDVVTDPVVTNILSVGLNLVSYPFSAEIDINNTTLTNGRAGKSELSADTIQIWNSASQSYARYMLKNTDRQWYNVDTGLKASGVKVGQGQGFWYKNTTNVVFNWVEPRPYVLE